MTGTESSTRTESKDWTMGFRFEDLAVEFRWREHSYGGEYLGYQGELVGVGGSPVPNTMLKIALLDAAAKIRRAQITGHWDLDVLNEPGVLKEVILELFDRSQTGEYLGNKSGNERFTVQDLAAILELDEEDIYPSLRQLAVEGKLSLQGRLLRTYDPNAEIPTGTGVSPRGMRR